MKHSAVVFVGVSILAWSYAYAANMLSISEGKPFPAHLSTAVFDVDKSTSFVGLGEAVAGEQGIYAVSMAGSTDTAYRGATPQKIRIGATLDQANPLFGKKIALLSLVDHSLAVVTDDAPNKLYLLRNPGTASAFLLPSEVFKLHNDAASERIVQMTGFSGIGAFFAALKGSDPFGQGDASLTMGTVEIDETKKTIEVKQGDSVQISVSSAALKIGHDLHALGDVICMATSNHLKTCYSGFSVISGANVGSGARALVVGLDIPIAPEAAIGVDSIIGSNQVNTRVALYHLDSMWTTTGLDYVVVVGGVEAVAGDGKTKVFALPLVGVGAGYGTLAKKDAAIGTLLNPANARHVIGRAFSEAALVAGDLFTSTDVAVQVGGTIALPGDIVQMWVQKDAVFVVVARDDKIAGGVFSSQALFDFEGRITGWTDWRHVAGLTKPAVAAFLDANNGLYYAMEHSSWDTVTAVTRTSWGQVTWAEIVSSLFGEDAHGVQGIVDFPSHHSAFSQDIDKRTSLLCCTGYNKVALVQSGFTDSTNCFRATSDAASIARNSTAIPADILFWDDGAIADLGAIITADIVSDGTESWLVVGGSNGAAVLCLADGHSWQTGTLASGLTNLPAGLVWKRFFTGLNVRKICACGNTFFILTEDAVYRYTPSANLFGHGVGSSVEVANAHMLLSPGYVRFSDILASDTCIVLATDHGLFRSGNSVNMQTVGNASAAGWTRIDLPESMESVSRLTAISVAGLPADVFANARGGNVLVLSSSVGRSGTAIYRLACRDIRVDGVTDETVQLLPDCFTMQWSSVGIGSDIARTYFVSRGDYRNHVATDGALWLMSRNKFAPTGVPAFVEILPQSYRTMLLIGSASSRIVTSSPYGVAMGPLVQRSSDGSWLFAGSNIYGQQR